ncbi:MAG: Translation initiation factor 2, partial [uncultured Nocardioides sp.]
GQDPSPRTRQGVQCREQVRSREAQGDGGVRQVGVVDRRAPRRDAFQEAVRRRAEGRSGLRAR